MEIQAAEHTVRTCEYTKRILLKDGTYRDHTYKRDYIVKQGRIICGKKELQKKLTACKDREKIERIKALFEELEL